MTEPAPSRLEALLRRDRAVVVVALALALVIAAA